MHHHLLSCYLVHFQKFFPGPFQEQSEYLKREIAQVFIPFMGSLLYSLVSRSFLVRLSYFLNFFFQLRLFDDVRFQYSKVLVIVPFFPSVLILSWFGSSVFSVICLFLFITISISHFFMANSILIPGLYILIICMRVCNSL